MLLHVLDISFMASTEMKELQEAFYTQAAQCTEVLIKLSTEMKYGNLSASYSVQKTFAGLADAIVRCRWDSLRKNYVYVTDNYQAAGEPPILYALRFSYYYEKMYFHSAAIAKNKVISINSHAYFSIGSKVCLY